MSEQTKTIYFGCDPDEDGFVYSSHEELVEEARLNEVSIGAGAIIGDNVKIDCSVKIGPSSSIGDECIVGNRCRISYLVNIGNNVTIGGRCNISSGVTIGDNTTIANNVAIDENTDIGAGVTIGQGAFLHQYIKVKDRATIGDYSVIYNHSVIEEDAEIACAIAILASAKIKKGWKIKKIAHLFDEYKYRVSAFSIKGEMFVQMGCFTRSVKEWKKDFWNNDQEFKKGTPEGNERLAAFEKMLKLVEEK